MGIADKNNIGGAIDHSSRGGGGGVMFSAVCLGCCALGIKTEIVIKYLKCDRIN